jgi:hypothetical protein
VLLTLPIYSAISDKEFRIAIYPDEQDEENPGKGYLSTTTRLKQTLTHIF